MKEKLLAVFFLTIGGLQAQHKILVTGNHDGDSYMIRDNDTLTRIRLYGCDAPEVYSNYVTATQPGDVRHKR